MSKPYISLLDPVTNKRLLLTVDAESISETISILFKNQSGTVALTSDLETLQTSLLQAIQTSGGTLTEAQLTDIVNAAKTGMIPADEKGAVSGVATLDAGGKVPASQLPASAGGITPIYRFTATEGQIDFLTTGSSLSTDPMVYLNGALQDIEVTYTVTDKTVTFLDPRDANEIIVIQG